MTRDLKEEARQITARFGGIRSHLEPVAAPKATKPAEVVAPRAAVVETPHVQDTRVNGFRVLLVGPEEARCRALKSALDPFGYHVTVLPNPMQTVEELVLRPPDLVLADVAAPILGGYDLCRVIKQHRMLQHIPIVLLIDSASVEGKVRAFQVGADDVFPTTMEDIELRARVRALVRVKVHYQRLSNEVRSLEFKLKERAHELEDITLGLVAALEKANEMNDQDTGRHIRRVCLYSRLLAEARDLSPGMVQRIFRYASLHDVGKVAVPDSILKKEGTLTPLEQEEMRRHTVHGYRILKEARADDVACNIVLCHHERWDGSGYPQGLRGPVIPVEARIVAVADVYDALTTRRCYKPPFPTADALEYMKQNSGTHFDPRLIGLFFENLDAICEIQSEYDDEAEAAEA